MDDDTYYISYGLETNRRDKIYIQFYEPTNGTKYLSEGKNIVYLLDYGWVYVGVSINFITVKKSACPRLNQNST